MREEALEKRIVELLHSSERPLSFEEIARALDWTGDLRPLRKLLAWLVREGIVRKVPDYERRMHAYTVRGG